LNQSRLIKLKEAEAKALRLFHLIEKSGLIHAGQTELELNNKVYDLAKSELGINKFWHKRIVRAGENTLFPYKENPSNLIITDESILFLDLGPIFDEFEADIGRTYVIGKNPDHLKLKQDVEKSWYIARDFYLSNPNITAAELFHFCEELAENNGWEFGGEIAGHLVGKFPHERLMEIPKDSYIHPENDLKLHESLINLDETHWIIEIHFVDRIKKIGGFYEQLAI